MLKPLEQWICDVCGNVIDSPSKGYVIWKNDFEGESSFKIIHHGKCDLKDHILSVSLENLLGTDGLTYLMSFLSVGPIKIGNGMSRNSNIADMHEFVDLVRRLQTPHYEEARQYFSDPEVLEQFSDGNEYYPYLVEQLKRINQKQQTT